MNVKDVNQVLVDKILQIINKDIEDIEIDKSNYHELSSVNFKSKSCAFIDGGCSMLFDSPSFAIGILRTVSVLFEFKNNKMNKKIIREEYYCIMEKDSNTNVNVTILENNTIKINKTKHADINQGQDGKNKENLILEDDDFHNILTKLMRTKEWQISKNIQADLIVIDGTFDDKDEFLKINKQYIIDSQTPIIGLSKTNTLLLKNNSYTYVVNKNSNYDSWVFPINSNKFICKFHKLSEYVFVAEIHKKENIKEILGILKSYSKDPSFLGYPYGLLFVDQLARITNEEREYYITKLSFSLGKDFEKLDSFVRNKNAHSILDNMRF